MSRFKGLIKLANTRATEDNLSAVFAARFTLVAFITLFWIGLMLAFFLAKTLT